MGWGSHFRRNYSLGSILSLCSLISFFRFSSFFNALVPRASCISSETERHTTPPIMNPIQNTYLFIPNSNMIFILCLFLGILHYLAAYNMRVTID